LVCRVSLALYRQLRQVVVSDAEAPADCRRPLLQWHASRLPFPHGAIAAISHANVSAARRGWRWRWLIVADDDTVVTPTPALVSLLERLPPKTPWYIGFADGIWRPGPWPREESVVVNEPHSRLKLHPGSSDSSRVRSFDYAPACSLPSEHAVSGAKDGCTWHPEPSPAVGCTWELVRAACPLRALPAAPSATAETMPLTPLYGNGMLVSGGMLGLISHGEWLACAAERERGPAGHMFRLGMAGSDWHQSRCLWELSKHYPVLLATDWAKSDRYPAARALFEHYHNRRAELLLRVTRNTTSSLVRGATTVVDRGQRRREDLHVPRRGRVRSV